ncbi:glucose-1-phosphate adenylyltransferase large subunit 1 isoform X1 [Spinacia oleracea]|uniref:Glucose-1-phosphate adenylyltransferase large subunit 1 isoform X1 n=1 Tax=Spinacia oleracea TaxID=3562 RepID=A0ABM3RH83_SPIOL|nr:glucose-1-phosphate adenylyltransferase large subunit 1-like isoform X1 [Spinacia oleracea]
MAFEVGGARNKNIKNVLILYGDQLYTMDYMDLVQSHIDRNSDITVSCVPVGESFVKNPRGDDLESMQVDTQILGLSQKDASSNPYIASMGV